MLFRRLRDRCVNFLSGIGIRDTVVGAQRALMNLENGLQRLENGLQRLENRASNIEETSRSLTKVAENEFYFIRRHLTVEREWLRIERDNIDKLRSSLERVRQSSEYGEAFTQQEPLISVRIATFKKTEELIEVAIASVLQQSYQRFEIVVVNDGPNDRTRAAISGLKDSRIRYFEFPERSRYPQDQYSRWMVAGSPGMNRATQLARGTWIAPLDDDDKFTPDHLEKLLALALEKRVELAYGALLGKQVGYGIERKIWSFPPELGQFNFLSAIYLKQLDFFRYDQHAWLVDEPGDWNLVRRMSAAGVTMATTQDVVGTLHMVHYTIKD